MRRGLLLSVLLLLPVVQGTGQATWNVSSPSVTAVFRGPNMVGLVNHLTGESLGVEDPVGLDLPAIRLLTRTIEYDEMASVEVTTGGGLGSAILRGSGAEYLIQAWTDPGGDLVLTQEGSAQEGGMAAIYWSLAGINASQANLLVPGTSGVCIDSSHPLESYQFSWPTTWEAQMMIMETEKGGFLIWSDDTQLRFKDLNYRREGGLWEIALGTQNTAPFDDLRDITSVRWRITAFSGDWRSGAAIYRGWMEAHYGLPRLGQDVPWARDIRFVTIMGNEKDLLEPLAQRVNSSATLLYLPHWRHYEYDRYYPNYTATAGFAEFVAEAHRLGFRVMVHVNYFGVSPDHPLYQELEEHHMRNPYTGEPYWWEWTSADPPIYIAYINPASARWREILTQALLEVRETYGVDAFHLDCSHAVFNDANGLVDGLTPTQGNLELHRQLREALPGVAFSGEGLDELTIRHEDFAQRHVLMGINHFDGTWDGNLIDHLHPISAYLFTPFNTMYGYLGICEPDSDPSLWHAWDSAYESLGVIPTLWLRRASQLEDPGPEMRGLLAKASYFTTALPVPVYPAPDPSVKFAYLTADGRDASYLRKDFGVVLQEGNGEDGKIVVGRVSGVTWAETRGSIPGWLAYNSSHILGLDPSATYLLMAEDRDATGVHVASLPQNVVIERAVNRSSLFAVSLVRNPEPLFDFVSGCRYATKSISFANGSRGPMSLGATFQEGSLSCGGDQRRAIYSTPPSAGSGETIGTYSVSIPPAGAQLRFLIGLTDMVRPGRSDGATFRVVIEGATVYSQHHSSRSWREAEIDLRSYAGRRIQIAFSLGPGPSGDPHFDLGAWGEPRLVPYVPDPFEMEIFCPSDPLDQVREGVESVSEDPSRPGHLRVLGHLPMTLALLFEEPTVVQAPFDLTAAPYEVRIVSRGIEEPVSGYAQCVPASVDCGGVTMHGLFEHPPPSGRTEASFLLRLPDYPVAFQSSVGVRDGSLSEGVLFILGINWDQVASVRMLPSRWKNLTLDLSGLEGRTVVLTLQTDPDGRDYYDWAAWGEPRIIAVRDGAPLQLLPVIILLLVRVRGRHTLISRGPPGKGHGEA